MSDAKIKLVGVTVALLLHLVVAVALTQDVLIALLRPEPKEQVEKTPEPEPAVSFQFLVKQAQAAPEEEAPKPTPKKLQKRYRNTTDEQAEEKPKHAKFYGDKDTVAQSDTQADAKALEQPSVRSEAEKNTSNLASRFQDGSLEHEKVAQSAVEEIPDPASAATPEVQPAEEVKPQKEQAEQKEAAQEMARKYLDAQNKVAIAESAAELEKKRAKERLEALLKQQQEEERKRLEEQKRKEELRKLAQEKARKAKKSRTIDITGEPGFRPETDAQKRVGSITRQGIVSSDDTEATPLGRYKKAVLKSISQEWYRRLGQHPDLLKPGVIQLRWYVHDNGRVKGIVLIQELQGSEIQKSITFQAIASAKIPTMPRELKLELQGDPVEFDMKFQFN